MDAILLRRFTQEAFPFTIRTANSLATGMDVRDALTAVIVFALEQEPREKPTWIHHLCDGELLIERVQPNNFTIQRHSGEFISRLCSDEMIAFVVTYLLTGKELFSGFRSYEANIARWNHWNDTTPAIEGLLAN